MQLSSSVTLWFSYIYFILFHINGLQAQTGSWAYDYTYFDRGMMMEILDGQILINAQTYSKTQTNLIIIYNLLIDPNTGEVVLAKEFEKDSIVLQIDRGLIHHNHKFYNSGGMSSYKVEESDLFQMMIAVFDENLDSVRIIPFRDSTLTSFGRDLTILNDKIYLWGNSGVGFSPKFNVLV